jgi:NADH-quinone oxidoreductase subunit F
MDFESLAAADTMLGSAGVIVIDDNDCIVRVATRIIEFFAHESCGKCTPCREGLSCAVKILRRLENGEGREGDLEQLDFLCDGIFGNSFCALGDGAAWGLRRALQIFRDEFIYHVEKRECPFH